MKIVESWLKEWVNPDLPSSALADALSLAGLEVDSVEDVAGHFTGVVVGRIESMEPHPNANKLNVCRVSDGADDFQVVCGAPNVFTGMVVAFAKVGATLPNGMTITERKVRDVDSLGMLCGADELGVTSDEQGLWDLSTYSLRLGDDLREALELNDRVLDIDLTPNRGDCLGLIGVAREVGAITGASVKSFSALSTSVDEEIAPPKVVISAPDGCVHYCARFIEGVNLKAPTPLWLKERLRRSGMRSIDPVVDVTNYVMLLLGQPMHAFDADKIEEYIEVRWSREDDTLLLIDGSDVTPQNTLVIADAAITLALAGVMGGKHSAISESTTRICLESACFKPEAVAGRARQYGLTTESSHRFERGVDPEMAPQAIEFATNLIIGICGGRASAVSSDRAKQQQEAESIVLRSARLEQLVGMTLEARRVESILSSLGFSFEAVDGGWRVLPLSFRYDVAIEEDLIEEIIRINGYHNIPARLPKFEPVTGRHCETKLALKDIQLHLVSRGYRECVTYSFISERDQALFHPALEGLKLVNPISSEMAVMRTSILPGLVNALRHNLKHGESRFSGFESGLVFHPTDSGMVQRPMLAAVLYGPRHPANWADSVRDVDFFDMKGDIESLLQLGRHEKIRFEAVKDFPALHPGQSARIYLNGEPSGYLGVLHPVLQAKWGLAKSCLVFEIQLEKLVKYRLPSFRMVSRFPSMERDLAFIVEKSILSSDMLETIQAQAGEDLKSVRVFDVYQGDPIPGDQKSIAFRLTFQNDRETLVDASVNTAIDRVVVQLTEKYRAQLRD